MERDDFEAEPIRIFATVGSTRFDDLISTLLSPDFLNSISESKAISASSSSPSNSVKGKSNRKDQRTELTIQYGSTPIADILTCKDSPFLARRDENSALNPAFGLYRQEGKGLINRSRNPQLFDAGLTGSLNLGIEIPKEDKEKDLRRRTKRMSEGKEEGADLVSRGKERALQESGDDWMDENQDEKESRNQTSMFQSGLLEAISPQGVKLKLFPYTSDLIDYFENADIVITHAGSGTILEVLRLPSFQEVQTKSPFHSLPRLVVVPNTSLMDNHQVELAEALASRNHLIASLPSDLVETIQSLLRPENSTSSTIPSHPEPFPPFDPSKFRQLVDEEMGFL